MSNLIASKVGLPALPDNNSHENRMEVRSESSNRVYIVAQSKKDGEWQCSCPGWVMKKAGKARGCKHLAAILPAIASLPAAKAQPKELKSVDVVAKPVAPVAKAPKPKDSLDEVRQCLADMEKNGVKIASLPTSVRALIEAVIRASK